MLTAFFSMCKINEKQIAFLFAKKMLSTVVGIEKDRSKQGSGYPLTYFYRFWPAPETVKTLAGEIPKPPMENERSAGA